VNRISLLVQSQQEALQVLLPKNLSIIDRKTIRTERISDPIGRGAFAEVFKAEWRQELLGRESPSRPVALKKYDGFEALSDDEKKVLIKELSVMATLSHSNVVPLFGVCQDGVSVYVVMDLMHSDLDKIIHGNNSGSGDKISPKIIQSRTVLKIVQQISEGMAFVESRKVVHHDIKSSNLFARDSEMRHFCIGDFGLSTNVAESLSKVSVIGIRGTVAYMAPEIILGLPHGLSVDMYSACVFFVELITGIRPWANRRGLASLVEGGRRLPVPEESESCPSFLVDIVRRSFEAKPEEANTRPTFAEIVGLFLKHESDSSSERKEEKLMKLKEKLLEAKANDSYVYKATWQKLSSDNISGAEDVLRMIGSLKNTVEKTCVSRPYQSIDICNVQGLRAAAEAVAPKLHEFGERIAKECGGNSTYKGAPTKGLGRIEEKVRADYGGDIRCIVDAARGSIICETLDQLAVAVKILLEGGEGTHEVVRVKDRLSKPISGGYRDVMLNITIDSHICELQLHLASLIAIKSQAHRIYDILRSVGWEEHN